MNERLAAKLTGRILIVAQTPIALEGGWTVEAADTPVEGAEQLRHCEFDAVVLEGSAEAWLAEEALEELDRAQSRLFRVPVVILRHECNAAEAVRYVRSGAHDVAANVTELHGLVEAAVDHYRAQRDGNQDSIETWRRHLVGTSRAMVRTTEVIQLIASRRSTVLITGETGTGKEMVAKALHLASPRASQPMVAVNCTALPENLLEAELFGHVKGAFTGAIQHRVGRFEQAHRGTLFLDEVGDLPLDIQTKLLRVLQEREFQRVGSSETVRVDVRVVAATNVDLVERIRAGRFREDLYYRLNVVPISTPPLRERLEDIPGLVAHFIAKIAHQENISPRRISPEALARLASYSWPGNVRQLENAVEMAMALCGDREILHPSDFALPLTAPLKTWPGASPSVAVPDAGLDFEQTVGRIERQILEQALRKAHGNKTAAAGMLRLKRTTLAAKLKSLEAVA